MLPRRANRTDSRQRRWLRRAAILAVAFCLAWGGGFFWFVSDLPKKVPDAARKTDAIVVLTGGSGRVDQGLRLLAEERAEQLFVSGVYKDVDIETLLAASPGAVPESACCVTLGYEAHSTRGNAAETAQWITANGIESVRLVTAAYHMPRSLLEFRRQLPRIEIVPHPVFPAHVKQESWWRWPGSAHLLVQEYNKFLVTLFRGFLPFAIV